MRRRAMRPRRRPPRTTRLSIGGVGGGSGSSLAVVEELDNGLQKRGRRRAIDHAMVERQRQRHHRSPRDFAAIDRGLLDDPADSENRGLAEIQYRCEGIDTVGSEVGDGKDTSGYI